MENKVTPHWAMRKTYNICFVQHGAHGSTERKKLNGAFKVMMTNQNLLTEVTTLRFSILPPFTSFLVQV